MHGTFTAEEVVTWLVFIVASLIKESYLNREEKHEKIRTVKLCTHRFEGTGYFHPLLPFPVIANIQNAKKRSRD